MPPENSTPWDESNPPELKDGRRKGFAIVMRADLDTDAFRGLSGASIKVYLALLCHLSDGIECWPSRERLAKLTGLHPNAVSREAARLEEAGFVERRWRGVKRSYVITSPNEVA
jgi:DNA-binding MarR family transcriptional regulator